MLSFHLILIRCTYFSLWFRLLNARWRSFFNSEVSMTFNVSICVKNFALQIFLFNKTAQIFNKISFINFKVFSTVWKRFRSSLNCSVISSCAMIYLFIIILIFASDLIITLLIKYFTEILITIMIFSFEASWKILNNIDAIASDITI